MIEIRTVRGDEVERFRALRLRSLRDAPEAFASTESTEGPMAIKDWKRWVTEAPERRVLVADRGGELVGTASVGPYQGKPELLSLFALWVAPDVRRTGVGRRLVEGLLDFARGTDRKRLRVHVNEKNAAALAFFAALGFEDTGERLPFREDLGVDGCILERRIG